MRQEDKMKNEARSDG